MSVHAKTSCVYAEGNDRQRMARCLEQLATAEDALRTVRRTLCEFCNTNHKPDGNDAVDQPLTPLTTVSAATPLQRLDEEDQAVVYLDQAIVTCLEEDLREEKKKTKAVQHAEANMQIMLVATKERRAKAEATSKNLLGPWYVPTCIPYVMMPIVSSDDPMIMLWNALSLFFIAYLAFSMPFTLAFDAEPEGFFWVLGQVITLYFVVDLPLNFFIAPYDDDGRPLKSPSAIARRYLKGWFWLDALTSIPWDWLPDNHGHGSQAGDSVRFLRVFRMLRLTRLLRLVHSSKFVDRLTIEMESNPGMLFAAGLFRIVFTMLTITHWSACCWYCLGNQEHGADKTWVKEKLTDDHTLLDRYVYSVYFTLTTMTTVGYGDITPQNSDEVLFGIILLIVACLVFAALLGSFSDLLVSLGSEQAALSQKKIMLSQYRRWRDLPHGLFSTMRQHVISMWDKQQGFVDFEESLKSELPTVLRRELCFHIFGPVLKNERSAPFLAFMYDFDLPLKELSCMVELLLRAKGDFVFRRGDPSDRIFMLVDGSARISQSTLANTILTREDDQPNFKVYALPRVRRASPNRQRDEHAGGQRGISAFNLPQWRQVKAELQAIDNVSNIAARMIQFTWRRRRVSRRMARDPAGSILKNFSIHGRTVRAPAYFGEACLWRNYEEWDGDTSAFPYSLMCETVAEVVCLPRAAVQCVLRGFAPWLPSRFFEFQRLIAEGKMAELNDAIAKAKPVGSGTDAMTKAPTTGSDAAGKSQSLFERKQSTLGGDSASSKKLSNLVRNRESTMDSAPSSPGARRPPLMTPSSSAYRSRQMHSGRRSAASFTTADSDVTADEADDQALGAQHCKVLLRSSSAPGSRSLGGGSATPTPLAPTPTSENGLGQPLLGLQRS